MLLICIYTCIFLAYNKQQATITEESEGSNTPNDKNREVELQQLGDISYLYLT